MFVMMFYLNLIDRSVRVTEKKKGKAIVSLSPTMVLNSTEKLSNLENIYKLLNGRGTLLKSGSLVVGQADLDDLFDAVLAELHRHADEEIVDTVFTLEEHSARKDLFLILKNGFRHLDRAKTRSVVGRSCLQQADDLRTAIRRAGDDRIDRLFRK